MVSILHTGFPITDAVLEGKQEGKIFNLGNSSFVLHKSGFGSILNTEELPLDTFLELIASNELPQYFHIYDASKSLMDYLSTKSDLVNVKVRERQTLQYTHSNELVVDLPVNCSILKTSEFNKHIAEKFPLDLFHRFWSEEQDFIENSMAVTLKVQEEIVSICYSAAVSNGISEIDVYTSENRRGKGYASLTASVFINNCISESIIPNWDCFKENTSSLKTALSLGFENTKEYKLLSIYRKNEQKYP